MTITGDANLKLVYGVDESGATSIRKNSGSLGSDWDMSPNTATSSPTEGLPVVSDGHGGKAVITAPEYGLYTAEARWLEAVEGLPTGRDDIPAYGATDASGDWAFGCRFKWVSPYDRTSDRNYQLLWSYGRETALPNLAIGFYGDSTTPTAAELFIYTNTTAQLLSSSTTTTGSPGTNPIEKDKWYTVVVRVYWQTTGWGWKVYVRRESDGTLWTWTYTGADLTTAAPGGSDTSWGWRIGHTFDGTVSSTYTSAYAAVDDCWLYTAPMTDGEATSIANSGISIPWEEPDYRRAAHVVYSAVTKENADFPKTRPLPTGATVARHPVDVLCQDVRVRVEGWRPGRPWMIRTVDLVFDPAGPYGSHRARRPERMDLTQGVWRSPGPKPPGACDDARDVDFTHQGPRRRRGYKVRRDVDSTVTSGFNQFWTFRDFNDELFRLFKVGGSLYADLGGSVSEIASGWNANEPVSSFTLDGRLVLLSPSARGIWDGDASVLDDLGCAPPGSISTAAGAGGSLNGSYYYAATWYDPVSGDESGPITTSSAVTPSTQKVTVTLPASTTAPDPRFTYFKIYRTFVGGSAPDFYYTAQVAATAGSTTYDDTGDADGTELLEQVVDSSGTFLGYITGTPPDTFSIGVAHAERGFFSGGANADRVYIGEPNELARWYGSQWFAADGPVRALASWGSRLVVFTDNTVEIVESDFIRDADGQVSLNRTVISRTVGCVGPNAVISWQGQLAWMDRRGIYQLQGPTIVEISEKIRDLFPYVNTNLGNRVSAAWNHLSRTLWWTLPCAALQDDSSRMQTQFVMDLDKPGRWTIYGLEASCVGQFDDDLNGVRFGAMDMVGTFKELESYEGDGVEGDEAFTTEDDGTDDYGTSPAGIASISGNVVTAYGSPGWSTDALRGVHVVFRDRSTGTLYRYLIQANGAASLTLERQVSANLAAGDGYYLGGIPAFAQFAGWDFGSPNRKVVRQIQYELADLTMTDLYL